MFWKLTTNEMMAYLMCYIYIYMYIYITPFTNVVSSKTILFIFITFKLIYVMCFCNYGVVVIGARWEGPPPYPGCLHSFVCCLFYDDKEEEKIWMKNHMNSLLWSNLAQFQAFRQNTIFFWKNGKCHFSRYVNA